MKRVRKSEIKAIAVVITLAMVFCILTGIAPGTSIKANAAEKHLADYSVGEALPKDAMLTWDDENTDFTLILRPGEFWDDDEPEMYTYIQISEKLTISSDGILDNDCGNAFKPRDLNTASIIDTWYVGAIDVENSTITLTGTQYPPKFFFKDYKVGEAVTVADFVNWDADQSYFTLILKGGSYKVGGRVQASDHCVGNAWIVAVYTEGTLDYNTWSEEFEAYDAARHQVSNRWYVDSVDVSNKTVTLTGTAPTL